MPTIRVALSSIKPNPDNPRIIKDDKFRKLVASIQSFPEMLELRPIVVNSDNVVLGGNMRLRACQEAGMKEVPVLRADTLTPDQQREFIIKDNVGFGEWNWDDLANTWDAEELKNWGLDIPDIQDFSKANSEVDTDSFADEVSIVLKYSADDHAKVREALAQIAATPEQAIWKLLKLI